MIDLVNGDVGSLQTITDGSLRESGAVLPAVEALLLNSSDELAVFYDRGRCVAVVSVNSQDVQRKATIGPCLTARKF